MAPPLVVCNDNQRFVIGEQPREAGVTPRDILLEPVGRNTVPMAAAVALMPLESIAGWIVVCRCRGSSFSRLDCPAAVYAEIALNGKYYNRPPTFIMGRRAYGYSQCPRSRLYCAP